MARGQAAWTRNVTSASLTISPFTLHTHAALPILPLMGAKILRSCAVPFAHLIDTDQVHPDRVHPDRAHPDRVYPDRVYPDRDLNDPSRCSARVQIHKRNIGLKTHY